MTKPGNIRLSASIGTALLLLCYQDGFASSWNQTTTSAIERSEVTAREMSIESYEIPDCPTGSITDLEPQIIVHMPKHLNTNTIKNIRNVGQKAVKTRPDEKPLEKPNGKQKEGEPFHVYVRSARDGNYSGLARVDIIIEAGSSYQFYLEDRRYPGIAMGEKDAPVCDINPKQIASAPSSKIRPSLRQVSTFYVDLARFPTDVAAHASYNILVQGQGTAETPIVIDPKIRNDG